MRVLPPVPATVVAPALSGFSANVAALLERVEYRRCESGEDLEAIYRLRYDAYRSNGDIPETTQKLTTDRYDGLPNCYRFGVYVDGVLISTVRIHHVSLDMPFAPVMDIFGDVLMPRLRRGETFINPTMFAADPFNETAPRAVPYVTLRPAVIANAFFDTTSCVCVVRKDHTAFYRRIFGAVQAGLPRAHPSFAVDVMLYDSDCAQNMQPTLDRFPFFNSTPGERRMMFGKPAEGELAPLTILPTAKYLLAA
ncbi:MAG: hypothetical protein K5872_19865 [Rhizobiaceae bacterium]|nr:hypothetical protein [Rhizobiaceae bacterium]MCV0408479.1 hypothetical protein [Rhizobiaceae bacterium]